MPTDRPQSFANHRALPSPLVIAIFLILVANLGVAIWLAWQDPTWLRLWNVAVAAALAVLIVAARRCAQIVQDRVIRLEMRLRFDRVLPADQRAAADRLPLPQVVALRFASDAELPGLVRAAVAGELRTPDEIKRRIADWQADWLRV